jgi:lysylphosphatidylglycerol synthetase-like protein (DUF2156 family)
VTTEGLELPPERPTGMLLPAEEPELPAERVRTPLLGILALVLVVLAGIVQVLAISTATDGRYLVGTVLAWGAVAASVLGLLVGVVATVLGLGRRWAIAAMVLSLVSNPIVVLNVLGFIDRAGG